MTGVVIDEEEAAREWIGSIEGQNTGDIARLEHLVALLAEENQRQNLVAAASIEHVWTRHILDSAQLLQFVPRETPQPWIDLGTGAGFPGLVVAALRPDIELLMIESRSRRVEWLTRACNELRLDNAKVIGKRLEQVEDISASVISARAFAPLDKLVDLSARFSTGDTVWLLPKGRSARQELAGLTQWRHTFHVEQSMTDREAGIIVGTLIDRKGKAR